MDEESEEGDGDSTAPGVTLRRRDEKQLDLLLEMESLEPQQLMSVSSDEPLLMLIKLCLHLTVFSFRPFVNISP